MSISVFKHYKTSGADLFCNICKPFVSTLCNINRKVSDCKGKISDLEDWVAALEQKLQVNNGDFSMEECSFGHQNTSGYLHGKFREIFEIKLKKRNLILHNLIHYDSSRNDVNEEVFNYVCNFATQVGFNCNLITDAALLLQQSGTNNQNDQSLVRVLLKLVKVHQSLLTSIAAFLKTKPTSLDKVRVSLDFTYAQRVANRQLFEEVNSLKSKVHTNIKIDWRLKKVSSKALEEAQQPNLSDSN